MSTAVISLCGTFRYHLERYWDPTLPRLGFIMLNPSTADASKDDPTIRKCIGFAKRLGFGSISVTNLFAYRATDPMNLRLAGLPVGPDNDTYILKMAAETDMVICAWGANARFVVRAPEVLHMLRVAGVDPKALRILPGNVPAHPLMLPYTCVPESIPDDRITI